MRNSSVWLALAFSGVLCAQGPDVTADLQSSFKVNFPADSPVALVTADWGQSRATARGGAVVVDLHSTLQLKNTSHRHVRGITLLVLAQEVTPGGKGSVTVPSLDVEPGDTFPVRLDLRLMRPLQHGTGALVEVSLDGVLFEDLGFFGPNRLNCKRTMTAWELEARRDRRYFLAQLESGGSSALEKELLASLGRQAQQPRLDMQMARAGRSTNAEPEREIQFTFLQAPDAPVELLSGSARVAGNEARLPRLELQNRSRKPVRYVEVGWLLKDQNGREFPAGLVPAEVSLAPGQHLEVRKDSSLRFSPAGGGTVSVAGLTAFVNNVEFSDGQVWVPARMLNGLTPAVSAEEQRLAELYRRKGLDYVIQHLRRLR
ncbi:MAG: hypothetical protein IT161_19320 [Bryobacterales bacterium]|nr:hypothetical protein [Bryobacterales bacterium]